MRLEFPGGLAGEESSLITVMAWVAAVAQVRALALELLHVGVWPKKEQIRQSKRRINWMISQPKVMRWKVRENRWKARKIV